MFDQIEKPNQRTFNSMISGYGRCGNVDAAIDMLREMRRKKMKPNVVTYNALISAYDNAFRSEEGLDLLDKMESDEICPDRVTYNALIACCKNLGKERFALSLYDMMKSDGLKPDEVTFSTLLEILDASRNTEASAKIIEEARSSYECYSNVLSENKEIADIDLHQLSAAEARTFLDYFFKRNDHRTRTPVNIITGLGQHSKETPVLPTAVPQHLKDLGIEYEQSSENKGLLTICSESLSTFYRRTRERMKTISA